jgi:hypothetical protein
MGILMVTTIVESMSERARERDSERVREPQAHAVTQFSAVAKKGVD